MQTFARKNPIIFLVISSNMYFGCSFSLIIFLISKPKHMMWVVKRIFIIKNYFSIKKILLTTHIICFGLEIRKIIFNYSLLCEYDGQKEKICPNDHSLGS